jgi:putative transposase
MRNLEFADKELYHIYNRGVDKRSLFWGRKDLERFFQCMVLLNRGDSIGSLRDMPENRERSKKITKNPEKLVNFITYCINPNHFHLILEQVANKGVEKFMHKWEMSHSKYINAKYKRSGALFQGKFQAIHIDSNEYLLHLSAYVNLNNLVHKYRHSVSVKSSWDEYISKENTDSICKKEIVLEQFKNKNAYRKFAENSLKDILKRKVLIKELVDDGIELIRT